MYIDRIEEGIAVLENDDKTFISVPVSRLPDGVKEGDFITEENGVYSILREKTESRRAEIKSLLDEIMEK